MIMYLVQIPEGPCVKETRLRQCRLPKFEFARKQSDLAFAFFALAHLSHSHRKYDKGCQESCGKMNEKDGSGTRRKIVQAKGRDFMLKKIDCVMIRVSDVPAALKFYADVFGLKPVWWDERTGQAGLLFQENHTEVVLHSDPNIPGQVEVYYLVDDASAAVQQYAEQG